MVASSVAEANASESDESATADLGFQEEKVGNSAYLNRHNTEMFSAGRSFSGNERNKVWFNRGGTGHVDLSDLSGADSPNDGRAVLATDFDDDGDVDIFVHNLQRERHSLYRNDVGTRGGFLKIRLEATESQWEAIGATVLVTVDGHTTAQVLTRGAGYSSCQAPELVFGLGGAQLARIDVRWPSGVLENFGTLAANHRVHLIEGSDEALQILPLTTSMPDPLPKGMRLAVGDTFPAKIAVLDSEGEEGVMDFAALSAGETLYVNFWASYCGSCIAELPDLQELDASPGQHVVALSMDAPADLYAARDLFKRRGAEFPGFYVGSTNDGSGDLSLITEVVDIERLPIPSTLVIDKDRKILRIIRGPLKAPQ
ncbi:MAG: thiol-disulfide isomerase/thioredoxin [Candidatus Paceibacteria bacterium]